MSGLQKTCHFALNMLSWQYYFYILLQCCLLDATMKPEFPDQTKNNNNIEHWPITTQCFDHVIARFCREIEHCSIQLQNLAPKKFGTRLYDRRARSRHQFSGAGFWRWFLERVSLALGKCRRGAAVSYIGHWASRWIYESLRRMASVTPDIQLLSQLQSTADGPWLVLISPPTESRRLSWPKWLVSYQDGIPANGHLS